MGAAGGGPVHKDVTLQTRAFSLAPEHQGAAKEANPAACTPLP